jgi:hypothetical protein
MPTGARVSGPLAAAGAASRQEADALARKISQITKRGADAARPGVRRTEVTESEVNSWFVFRGRTYLPDGVTEPRVKLVANGIDGRAIDGGFRHVPSLSAKPCTLRVTFRLPACCL